MIDSLVTLSSHDVRSSEKVELLGLTFEKLSTYLDEWGVGATHAGRVFRGLHVKRHPLSEVPSLGRHAEVIMRHGQITQVDVIETVCAPDGTEKLLLELSDGAKVEAVLLPMRRERYTLCVSTQVGCAMSCAFCATGSLGLTRSLSAGEIIAQVYRAIEYVSARNQVNKDHKTLSHLVFMGMGEPLHFYDRTRDALRVLLDQRGVSFSARQVTVSTVGLVQAMRRFSSDFQGRVQLALSLHAGTDETRIKIIPSARKWPLEDLKQALLAHPLPGRRVLMLEYVVLPEVNDHDEELDGVARFCEGLRALVNLIPFNPFPNSPFRAPTSSEVLRVDQGLKARGVPCSIRVTRGQEKSGACGQLAIQGYSL